MSRPVLRLLLMLFLQAGTAHALDAGRVSGLFSGRLDITPLFTPVITDGRVQHHYQARAPGCRNTCLVRGFRGEPGSLRQVGDTISFVYQGSAYTLIPDGDQAVGFTGYVVAVSGQGNAKGMNMPFDSRGMEKILDVESRDGRTSNRTQLYLVGSRGMARRIISSARVNGFQSLYCYKSPDGCILRKEEAELLVQWMDYLGQVSILVNLRDG